MEVKMAENENEYQETHQPFEDQTQSSHHNPPKIISITIFSHTKVELCSLTHWLNSTGIAQIGVKTCA
ncbi:hypothetical protein AMECASPLE_013935 [Ameca splendens]|uniref:Uncharacterized protein n=1 Tax=Ameca splendens TaxID=208324 RepID=A0ABV0Z0B1_9TELE